MRKEKEKKENILIQTESMSGTSESGRSAVSGVSGVGERNEKIEKIEKIEKNRRIEGCVSGTGSRSAVSGMGEMKKSGMSAVSSMSDGILRLRGSGDTARDTARGRAGHVKLQGESSGTIPIFPVDEILIRPDQGNQEVPSCLEPSDHSDYLRIGLSGTERSSKCPKIQPTLDDAGIEIPGEIEGRRKGLERWREWDPGEATREWLGQPEEPDRLELLGQPKGQKRLLCLVGVDGLDEVLAVALPLDSEAVGLGTAVTGTGGGAVSRAPDQDVNLLSSERAIGPEIGKDLDTANPDTTNPNATESEVHCPARPDPWPDEVSYEGLQQPKYHSGEWDPDGSSEKRTEGEEVLDMRLAARLEAVNLRLRALSAEHALELGTEAIS